MESPQGTSHESTEEARDPRHPPCALRVIEPHCRAPTPDPARPKGGEGRRVGDGTPAATAPGYPAPIREREPGGAGGNRPLLLLHTRGSNSCEQRPPRGRGPYQFRWTRTAVERALRGVAVGRKNHFGSPSDPEPWHHHSAAHHHARGPLQVDAALLKVGGGPGVEPSRRATSAIPPGQTSGRTGARSSSSGFSSWARWMSRSAGHGSS